jgi:ribose-phosphate pyrophosphokinase
MMKVVLIGKSDFAGEIADLIPDSDFIEIEERIFPDGEVCPRLLLTEENQVKNNHAIVVLQLELGQPKNRYLISLLWTIYNVKRFGPAKITCIMPYHLYARQDRESRKGEPVSSRYMGLALESAGMDVFMTLSSHIYGKSDIHEFFSAAEASDVSAIPHLVKAIKSHVSSLYEIICFSPDEGALRLAKEAATAINSPYYGAIKKHRDPNTGEITQSLTGIDIEIQGRSVLLIDDLVSSGGTMIGAAKILKEYGAKEVIFAYIHAVHSPDNFKNILKANPSVILATNTIKTNLSGLTTVSVIPLISTWIKENS